MSRAAGLCKLCGGPRRGKSARLAAPVADCARCGAAICPKHQVWDTDRSLCTRCARILGRIKQT